MRRVVLSLSAIAVMVVVAAGIAWAAVIDGGNQRQGANNLGGTAQADRIYGLDGADRLRGFAGDDYLEGGAAKDDLRGGTDDDQLNGGLGADRGETARGIVLLAGQAGDDYIDGFSGADDLRGGPDDDHLYGGLGVDIMFGEGGNDFINAIDESDADTVNCGDGTDDIAVLDANQAGQNVNPTGDEDTADANCEDRLYVDTLSP